jgi:DNA repair photolyase
MFTYNGSRLSTFNAFTGCLHACKYCYSERLINTRLKDTPKYKDCGFKPTFHPDELNKKFKPDEFVFVSSMGDIAFATNSELQQIIKKIKENPQTKFLFCTKDPSVYLPLDDMGNVYFGTTLETNRDITKLYSKAPYTCERYRVMTLLEVTNKFVSIEPIMDFDLDIFSQWILDINPKIVEIGCDNYKNSLPEPNSDKIKALIKSMESSGIEVICKDGLYRLLKDDK